MNPFLHPIRNLAAKVHQKPQTTKYLFNFFSFPLKLTVPEPAEGYPNTVAELAEALSGS